MREAALGLLLAIGLAAATAGASPSSSTEISARAEPWTASERLPASELEPGQRVALVFGTRLGAVDVSEPWSDFRGTLIPAGHYELRYALQPRLKEHVGADAVRDFALLVPAESRAAAEATRPEEWIEASRRVSGTRHPAVMALALWTGASDPPSEPVAVGGWIVVFRPVGDLALGFVVAGRAVIEEAF